MGVGPLLLTKTEPPRIRPGHVPRGDLVERLRHGLHRRLNLVSAPAGWGKTTLLAEWLTVEEQIAVRVALARRGRQRPCTVLVIRLRSAAHRRRRRPAGLRGGGVRPRDVGRGGRAAAPCQRARWGHAGARAGARRLPPDSRACDSRGRALPGRAPARRVASGDRDAERAAGRRVASARARRARRGHERSVAIQRRRGRGTAQRRRSRWSFRPSSSS